MNGQTVAGTGLDNRLGNEILLTSLYLAYHVDYTLDDSINTIKLILVKDKEPRMAFPSGGTADILDAGSVYYLNAPPNWANRKRFRIIWSKQFVINKVTRWDYFGHVNIKTRTKVQFSGTSSGISSIHSNAYYLLLVSDSVTGAHPSVDVTCRMKFRDA